MKDKVQVYEATMALMWNVSEKALLDLEFHLVAPLLVELSLTFRNAPCRTLMIPAKMLFVE
jgi:hypothetical protein